MNMTIEPESQSILPPNKSRMVESFAPQRKSRRSRFACRLCRLNRVEGEDALKRTSLIFRILRWSHPHTAHTTQVLPGFPSFSVQQVAAGPNCSTAIEPRRHKDTENRRI